jgi:hypothetical protein
MGSKRPQCADDIFDSILLKQADGGDPGCSGGKARRCVLQVDAAQSEHRDLRPAGFAQGGEARGLGSRRLSLSEYRSENGKVGGLRFGAEDIGGSVAGGGEERAASYGLRAASERLRPEASRFVGGNVIGAQVDAVGTDGNRNVGAGIDYETSAQFPVPGSQFLNDMRGLSGELFEFERAQVFFAELDVVDAGMRGLGDFGEQGAAAGAFVAVKLASVGDVVEQTAIRHQLVAYYECGAYFFPRKTGSATAKPDSLRPRVAAELRSAWTAEGGCPYAGFTADS